MPFARSRTPAAEPVPGFGLDAPAPQLLQLDMDSDFRPRLPYQNVTGPARLWLCLQ